MIDTSISYSGKGKDEETKEEYSFEGSVTYALPTTVEEAIKAYGEEVVLSKVISAVTIDVQRVCRTAEDPDKAQAAVTSYMPGISKTRATGGISQKALKEKLMALPEGDRKEVLELLGIAG